MWYLKIRWSFWSPENTLAKSKKVSICEALPKKSPDGYLKL